MDTDADSPELERYFAALGDDSMREIARATLLNNFESPRGMVLVLASLLDIRLEELIRRVLDQTDATDRLFSEANAPLSTFSAKINLARSLQLIDDNEFRDLHSARKIRNDFAHKVSSSFDDQSLLDRAYNMQAYMDQLNQRDFDARNWFQMACMALTVNLYSKSRRLTETNTSRQGPKQRE